MYADPSDCNTSECWYPHPTNVVLPSDCKSMRTLKGHSLSASELAPCKPSPHCPCVFFPKEKTWPPAVRARLWLKPAAAIVTKADALEEDSGEEIEEDESR